MTTILEGENKIAPREALGSQEMWSRCPKNFACGAIYNGKITFSPLQQTQTTKKFRLRRYIQGHKGISVLERHKREH